MISLCAYTIRVRPHSIFNTEWTNYKMENKQPAPRNSTDLCTTWGAMGIASCNLHVAWFKWFWVSVSNSRSGWVLQGLYTIIALIYLLYHNTICILAVLFVFWDAERNKQLLWSSACRTNEYNPQIYIFKVSVGVVSAKNKTQHNKQTEEENKITFIHTRPETWKYCMRHEKQNKRKQNTLFCFASFYQTPHTPIVNRYIESMP